jgi:hypothetical protein
MSNTTEVELQHGQISVDEREQRSMITDLHHIGIETNGDRSIVGQPLSHHYDKPTGCKVTSRASL